MVVNSISLFSNNITVIAVTRSELESVSNAGEMEKLQRKGSVAHLHHRRRTERNGTDKIATFQSKLRRNTTPWLQELGVSLYFRIRPCFPVTQPSGPEASMSDNLVFHNVSKCI